MEASILIILITSYILDYLLFSLVEEFLSDSNIVGAYKC